MTMERMKIEKSKKASEAASAGAVAYDSDDFIDW